MFADPRRQKQRQGKYGTPRRKYLQALVTQFQKTEDEELKVQTVAHLGNFAYDPFNYEYFRELNILELFLDCLDEPNEKLVEFALAGTCNCCPDLDNAAMIVANQGIPLIISCLSSPVENTVLSAIVSLYYLCSPSTEKGTYYNVFVSGSELGHAEIITKPVIDCMRTYASAECVNVRFNNVAKAFLDKHVKQ